LRVLETARRDCQFLDAPQLPGGMPETIRANWKTWAKLAAPVLASIAGLLLLRVFAGSVVDQQRVQGWIAPLGEWAWVAFVAFLALRPVTLLPGQVFTAVGGLLFGALWATFYSLLGSLLASLVIFFLARRVGVRALKRVAGDGYDAIERVTRDNAFTFSALSCISPLMPTVVAQAAAFSAGAPFWKVALGTLIGTLPGTFVTASFGSALGQGRTVMTGITAAGMVLSLVFGVWIGRRMSQEVKRDRRERRIAAPRAGGHLPRLPRPPAQAQPPT
jgi:uncharacterized membrane protein YdjX (TVP38/TMEM64 family)